MDIQSIKLRFNIIGNSPALNYALEVASRVAPTNLSVLITGESGVGKEVFSQIIHQLSPRKHESFIAVNCGAIPEGTIDSELFGHEKGSFTGANEQRKGYFETVNKGTIFLDEIGEMPIGTQARLLRLLESGEFIKVGSSKTQKTDVRVLAATNVNLPKLISQGKFREDLYYRLNTVPIQVPSLRERKEDIPVLFRKFCVDFSERYKSSLVKLDEEATYILSNYSFPGNIRELKNLAEQVSVLSYDKLINKNDLTRFLPKAEINKLPALKDGNEKEGFSDREILYKMLFDIKGDLNDLKRFVLNMASGGNFEINDETPIPSFKSDNFVSSPYDFQQKQLNQLENSNEPPAIVIDDTSGYEDHSAENNYSLSEMEKEMIIKALEKHHGKRRDAALDLGISERTLYRKIKEYDIDA
jgi:transcriptional regulator with PAS, ATPase and Fis domain